jgi:type I restriction enzyme M protein
VEAEHDDGKPISRIFDNEAFGYTPSPSSARCAMPTARWCWVRRASKKASPSRLSLRDTENVPWTEDVGEYFKREVLPHAPDAWIDRDKTKVGYEIPFNRHFYVFKPPRPLAEIDAELKQTTDRILDMIKGLSA